MANYSYFSFPAGSGLQRFGIQTLPKCRGLKGLGGISESKARAPKEPKATVKAKPSGAKGQARPRQRTSKAAIKVGRQAPKEPKAKAKAKQGGAEGRKASGKGAQGKGKGQARPRQRPSKAALKDRQGGVKGRKAALKMRGKGPMRRR